MKTLLWLSSWRGLLALFVILVVGSLLERPLSRFDAWVRRELERRCGSGPRNLGPPL